MAVRPVGDHSPILMQSKAVQTSIHQALNGIYGNELRAPAEPETKQPPEVERTSSMRAPETGKGTVVDVIG